jgi:diguanylate cyclase
MVASASEDRDLSVPQTAGARTFRPDLSDRADDGSLDLLRRTLPLMSRHAAGFTPESYALWYEYVRGGKPSLRTEIDALVRGRDRLSAQQTVELHRKYLGERTEDPVSRAEAGLLELMDTVRSSVAVASTNATEFDAQLSAFDAGIATAESAEDVRQHVTTIRDDVSRMNRSLAGLTAQLEDSRRQVERLQGELRQARDEAARDALSGMVNRRGFDEALRQMCAAASAERTTLCLVMIDIDHFKRINDGFGHTVGDRVIAGIGQTLSLLTRRRDVAARYGGEEFALLLPETPLTGARDVAEKIRATVAQGGARHAALPQSVGAVTLSAGVARYVHGEPPENLVARADRALYAAKLSGRNRVNVVEG